MPPSAMISSRASLSRTSGLLQAWHRQELRKFAAQNFPSAKQARLERTFGQAEAARRGRDIHFMKIKQDQCLAIFRGQAKTARRTARSRSSSSSLPSEARGRLAPRHHPSKLSEPECGAAPNDRNWSPARTARWKRPLPYAIVRGPGTRAELPPAPSLRRGPVATKTVSEVDQRALPAPDDFLKGGMSPASTRSTAA